MSQYFFIFFVFLRRPPSSTLFPYTTLFRSILMTTMAALLGGVPMMLGSGVGSELRQPLGYAIVGGLALSQVLTLYTTPVVYIYLDRLQTWLFGERRKPAVSGNAAAAPAE